MDEMKFARLQDGMLYSAPPSLLIAGKRYYHPSKELYCKYGFYPIVETLCPVTEGVTYVKTWEQEGEEIRSVWVPVEAHLPSLRERAKAELAEIRRWLCENDWKVNKIVLGEWEQEDPRWLAYLADRAEKRTKQDALAAILNAEEEAYAALS